MRLSQAPAGDIGETFLTDDVGLRAWEQYSGEYQHNNDFGVTH